MRSFCLTLSDSVLDGVLCGFRPCATSPLPLSPDALQRYTSRSPALNGCRRRKKVVSIVKLAREHREGNSSPTRPYSFWMSLRPAFRPMTPKAWWMCSRDLHGGQDDPHQIPSAEHGVCGGQGTGYS